MKRIFFLLACLCLPFFSFAQKAGESRQLTRQDSLRLQQLLNGQVEIVIDDETQQEIDRLFNPEKWKMKSTPFPKKNMKFETELPRYYISQVDTVDGVFCLMVLLNLLKKKRFMWRFRLIRNIWQVMIRGSNRHRQESSLPVL
jgi:hypothetical protein